MANKVRNHFLDILRTLKPELLQDDHKIPKDVTWAKVHVQPDTHSCGVHVLTWTCMLMGIMDDSHKRLVVPVEEELRKAQVNIERQRKQQVSIGDEDEEKTVADIEDDDGDDYGEDGYEDEVIVGMLITISEFHGPTPTAAGGTNEGQHFVGSPNLLFY
ncbi:hypothetical protein K1719_012314 [Acacia pycnantha]|nr:hypothetical protein K1719_012314 [Acacia pycnantha]